MRVLVITSPDPVVTLEEAKAHLRVRHDSEDELIGRLIDAATASIDGPDQWLGRAIGVQTLEFRLGSFACTDIRLPCPPVISVTSVKYLGADGVEQTLDSSDYELFGRDISPAWGRTWPSTRSAREAVRIRYQAGYATVPEDIRAAILLMIGDLWSFRETAGPNAAAIQMSTTVSNLLSPHRIFA